jgi:hypothetical protein
MNKLKLTFAIGFLSLIVTLGKAQTYKIDTSNITFEDKLRPCYQVKVDPEPKDLKKAWAKYLKKNYSIKMKGIGFLSNKDILSGEDVTIEKVSSKRMNVYTQIVETASGSEMSVLASFGYDFFMGPEKFTDEFLSMKGILNTFLLQELNDYYSDELASNHKAVSKAEKEIKSLTKEISKNDKKIKSNDSKVLTTDAGTNQFIEETHKLKDKNTDAEIQITLLKKKIIDYQNQAEVLRQKQIGLLKNQ